MAEPVTETSAKQDPPPQVTVGDPKRPLPIRSVRAAPGKLAFFLIMLELSCLIAGASLAGYLVATNSLQFAESRVETDLLINGFQLGNMIVPATSLLVTAALALLVALVSLTSVLQASRQPSERLQLLVKVVEDTAARDQDQELQLEGEDEAGRLVKAIQQMRDQSRSQCQELEQQVGKQAAEIEKRSSLLKAAEQVTRNSSRARDLKEMLSRAAYLIQDQLNYAHVGIYLLDERNEVAILKAAAGEASQELLDTGYRQKLDEPGMVAEAVSLGNPRLANKADRAGAVGEQPVIPAAQSEAVLPLRIGDRITGAVDLHSLREGEFDRDSLVILQTMVNQLALAIENLTLQEEMQETAGKLKSAFGQYTSGTWQSFLQRTRRIRGLRYRGLQSEPPNGLAEEAVEALQLQRTVLGDERMDSQDQTMRNRLAIPMKLRGQTLGVVNVEFEGYRPTPETVAFYEEVTERLALALDNVRLIEETNLRSEQLKLLQEITAAAASHVNLGNLFADVTDRIRSGFVVEHCGVILFDLNRSLGSLVSSSSSNPISPLRELLGTKFQMQGDEMLEKIIQQPRSAILTGSGSSESPFKQILSRLGTSTQILVPLLSRGELLGVIMLNSADQERHFGEDDLLLLDQVSLQITTAIEIARVFERIEHRAERERQISEITSKVRASTNVDIIMQTAVQELAKALEVPQGKVQLRYVEGPADE